MQSHHLQKVECVLLVARSRKLAEFNRSRQGSADTIARLLILKEPPSPEAGEITDKRSINQRLVMERRANDVADLYADRIDPRAIEPAGAGEPAAMARR